ncbi:MAG: glycosyltransferase family 4 protein [bacterium]
MNIGIVTPWFERGAGNVSMQYITSLCKKNSVFVYARGGAHYEKSDSKWKNNLVTYGLRLPSYSRDYIHPTHFKKWIMRHSLEAVFFNEQISLDIILWMKEKMPEVKLGAYVDYYTEETMPIFALYDFLICNTKRHFSAFDWHPQAYYVPWGTDSKMFRYDGKVSGKSGPVFFHSAGLNPVRKGTDIAVRAFTLLNDKNSRFVIHSQKKLHFEDKAITSMLDNPSIEVIEKTVPPPGLYFLGDVYIYPSRLEGIGLTIAEAMMSGLPVIVTDFPPMNEFVTGDESGKKIRVSRFTGRPDGYYWPQSEADVSSLAEQMKFYADNFTKMSEMKASARTYAEKNLNWEDRCERVNEIFSESRILIHDKAIKEKCRNYIKKRSGDQIQLGKIILSRTPLPAELKSIIYVAFVEKRWKGSSL